jgi:protein-S-isoprenylcysteine O-methyltransferase Ste14
MALILAISFVAFAIIGRVTLQYYTTGNHGIRLADPTADPIAAIAGATFFLSFTVSLIIVGLDFTQVWLIPRLQITYLNEAACLVGLAGIAIVVIAQLQMGSAWRIGVDPTEETKLVTHGLYKKSRNPIYFGLGLYWAGLAILLPHPVVWLLGILCWISIEFIVRGVEEPYLRRLHGRAFESYVLCSNRYLIWS